MTWLVGCVYTPPVTTPTASPSQMTQTVPEEGVPETAVPTTTLPQDPPSAVATSTTAPPAPLLQITPQSNVSDLPLVPLAMRWRYDAADTVTAMNLYSLDGGPLPDLLLGAADGRVVTLGLAQTEYWRELLPASVHVVQGADFDGDGIGDVLTGSDDGIVTVLEGGEVRWQFPGEGVITAVLQIGRPVTDVRIIVASGDGNLIGLTSDGEQRWRLPVGGGRINQLIEADVHGDGMTDLLLVDDMGQVTAVAQQGELLWQTSLGSAIRQFAAPDFNSDGAVEVVAGTMNGEVTALTSTGSILWRQAVGGVVTTIQVADLMGSGAMDVLVGSGPNPGLVTAFDQNGQALWQSAVAQRGVWSLAVGDLDDDARLDLVLGSDDGQVIVLDNQGRFRGQFTTQAPVYEVLVSNMDQSETSPRPELMARAGHSVYLLDTMGSGTVTADPPPASPQTMAAVPADLLPNDGVTLLALGDLSLVSDVAEREWLLGTDGLLAGIRPLLDNADLVALNLETPLSWRGLAADKPNLYLASPRLAAQLSGVDVALLANDHILDYGIGGLNDTLTALLAQDVAYTGVGVTVETAVQPVLRTVDGLRFAFLSFTNAAAANTYAAANQPGVARADAETITAAVTNAKTLADFVIVGLHTSPGTVDQVSPGAAKLAYLAVDAGASLVLGYGSETRLRTEQYHSGYIVYALGDMLRDESAILQATFTATGLRPPQLLLTAAPGGQPQLLAQDGGVVRLTDFPSASATKADPVRAEDVPHYDLDVNLGYDAHMADVQQTVTLLNDSTDEWAEVVFQVAPAYWEDMFQLHDVTVTLAGDVQTAVFDWQQTILRVQMPRLVMTGEAVAVTLAYHLDLPLLDPTGWGPEGNAGWDSDLIQMGDWYPTVVPYENDMGWQTWDYWPVGDPVINRLADFAVTVHAPPSVTVAAPGLMLQGSDTWQYRLDNARAFSFLASPNYVRFDGDAGGIPVTVYVTRAYQSAGPTVLQTTVQALTLFNDLYGPYPYDSIVIAQNGFLTAMEYSGIVSLSGYSFSSYNDSADSLLVAIIAHEVSHQWWYGGVGNNQVDEPWLDEGLAMISELLFYERYYPDLVDWWWQFRVVRWEPSGPVNARIYDYDTSESFVHHVYGQAASFMADLRDWMGDAAFRSFLQTYYQQYRGRFATGADFLAAAQAETAVDLTPLIAQYFQQ